MNNKIILGILATIIVGGVFYGGMKYGEHRTSSAQQTRMGQFAANGGQRGMGMIGGFCGGTVGEVISKDANSITLKLRDGGSRIIFVSSSTPIMKSAPGSLQDIVTGSNLIVTGSANTDGSINAQSMQIRPATTTQQ